MWKGASKIVQTHHFNKCCHPLLTLRRAEHFVDQPQADVVGNAQPREQPVLLKHNPTLAAHALDGLAIHFNNAATLTCT